MTFLEKAVVKLSPQKNWKSLNESFVSESSHIQRSLLNFFTFLWTENCYHQRMLKMSFSQYTVCESVHFFEERFKEDEKKILLKERSKSLSCILLNKFLVNVFSFVGQKPYLSILTNFLFCWMQTPRINAKKAFLFKTANEELRKVTNCVAWVVTFFETDRFHYILVNFNIKTMKDVR